MFGETASNLARIEGISHRFFGRQGGTSPRPFAGLNTSFAQPDAPARVEENLARIRFQIGVPPDGLFASHQVHGKNVIQITPSAKVEEVAKVDADALWTTQKDVAVAVRTADCVPILVVAVDASVIGAIHAGWRGAVSGVIGAAVEALRGGQGDFGPSLVAAIGPGIGFEHFEVGPEVIEAASQVVPLEGLVRSSTADRHLLDLRGMVARLLEQAGIEDVEMVGGCTFSCPKKYFSHRAEHGQTGRQMSVVARTTPPLFKDEIKADVPLVPTI